MTEENRNNTLVVAATAVSSGLALGDHSALATVVLATVPSLVTLAAPIFLGDAKAKLDRWTSQLYTADPQRTPEEVRALYEEKVRTSPAAREAVLRSVNKLLESDECATDSIAALTAEYVLAGLRPDDFYRSLLSILADVSSTEMTALRRLLGEAIAVSGEFSHIHVWSSVDYPNKVLIAPGDAEYPTGDSSDVDTRDVEAPMVRRLVQLLRNALLVEDGGGMQLSTPLPDGPPGAHEKWPSLAVLAVTMLRRVQRFVR
jgi:hypothetical protein